jgi:hypothetical protein
MSRSLSAREARKTDSSGNVLPPLPKGNVEKDLVVMSDGRQVSGAVLIKSPRDESGEIQYFSPVLVQNGVETDLKKVEDIKLAKPKRRS